MRMWSVGPASGHHRLARFCHCWPPTPRHFVMRMKSKSNPSGHCLARQLKRWKIYTFNEILTKLNSFHFESILAKRECCGNTFWKSGSNFSGRYLPGDKEDLPPSSLKLDSSEAEEGVWILELAFLLSGMIHVNLQYRVRGTYFQE